MQSVARRVFLIRILWTTTTTLGIPSVVGLMNSHGLGPGEVSLVVSAFAQFVALLEIPSGYFADRFGREISMRIGAMGFFLGSASYCMAHTLQGFISAELCFAVGVSFFSGSDQAYLYELMAAEGKHLHFSKTWGKISSWSFVVIAFLSIIGGSLSGIHPRLPFVLEAFVFVVMIKVTFSLPRIHVHDSPNDLLRDLKRVFKEAWLIPELRIVGTLIALITAVQWVTLFSYEPYLQKSGYNSTAVGFSFAAFALMAAVGAKSSHAAASRIGLRKVVGFVSIFSAATPVLMASMGGVGAAAAICPQQLARGFLVVLTDTTRNALIGNELRATHASVQSMLQRSIQSVAVFSVGAVISRSNMETGLLALVLGLAGPIAFFYFYGKAKKVF